MTEEMTTAEASAIAERLVSEYRFISKLRDVLARYEDAKAAIPELERSRADLNVETRKLKEKIATLNDYYERTSKEAEADIRRRKEQFAKDHATNAERLNSIIEKLQQRREAKETEVRDAEWKAGEKVKQAEARALQANKAADEAIANAQRRIEEKEAEYQRAKERLDALRQDLQGVKL